MKHIQHTLNYHIRKSNPSLKGFNEIKVDGKFGKDTQNLVYVFMGKVVATPEGVLDKKKYY